MAGNVFGRAVLGVATQPSVAAVAARARLMRGLVQRFVAGESLDEALPVLRALNAEGLRLALGHLGENTTSRAEADTATQEVNHALEQIKFAGLDAYVSVKLTQLGLDVGEHVVMENTTRLLERARTLHNFVRVDMEGSRYTARTIELFSELRGRFDNVGIVLQAYLYRTRTDVRTLTELGARIRLCKGAYSEPPHIAYRRKRDTDRNFVVLMEYLLLQGHFPAIATHDEAIIAHACEFVRRNHISHDRFEFQMLYGVRRDLQLQLAREGYGVRVYVPYGSQWYPYLTRRLAERPANLVFVLSNLLRERARERVTSEQLR